MPHQDRTARTASGIPLFVFQLAGIAFGVFLMAQAGSWFVRSSPGIVSPVWPASGFALAAALTYGLDRTLPAVFVGMFLSNMLSGDPGVYAYASPVAGVVETLIGWFAVKHIARVDITLPGLHDFARFVAAACIPGPAFAALTSVGLTEFEGRLATSQLNMSVLDVWQVHAFGTLVFGLFFLFALRRQDFRPVTTPGRYALLACSTLLWAILAVLLTSGQLDAATSGLLLGSALLLALLVSILFGLRTAALFQAMFVFLVPACVVIYKSWAVKVFAFNLPHDRQTLINGLAFFSSLGCLLIAAFRDELAALSLKFSLALDSADLCVWEWTPAGWLCRAPSWNSKFGLPPDSIVPSASVRNLVHPDDIEGFESTFSALSESREARWDHTYRMRERTGRWVWVRSQAQPMRWSADDELTGIVGVTRDITAERDAMQSRISAIEMDAELRTLRSQLNPHFLFNALNSVRALIGRRDESARAMVTSLGNLLRELLGNRDSQMHTVEREMRLVSDYLSVETIRFGERLRQTIECEPGAERQRVPGMLILTMVENAVKHGISKREDGGLVAVKIGHDKTQNTLVITVTNDGRLGIPSGGFGIANCRRRLLLVTNGRGMLDVREIEGARVEARATLPWDESPLDTTSASSSV